MKRRFLRSVACALVGAVLCAQLAVSAYACPGAAARAAAMAMPAAGSTEVDTGQVVEAAPVQQAVNCEGMTGATDPSFANLCAAHCQQGQQSDHAATLAMPAVLLSARYATPVAPDPALAPRPAADAASALAAASPPLAILHCCFRI